MAKRKDSVALFEVITATRNREQAATSGRSSLRTPKWWFKNKSQAPGEPSGSSEFDPTTAGSAPAQISSSTAVP